MLKGSLSGLFPFVQLLLIFILVLLSAVFVTAIGLALAIPFIGSEGFLAAASGGASIDILRYLQLVQSFSVFIVPAFLAGWFFSSRPFKWLWFNRAHFSLLFLSVVLIFMAQPLSAWLGYLNYNVGFPEGLKALETWMKGAEENASNVIYQFLDTSNIWVILFNVFLVAVLPAFGEEMLFRGAIQPVLHRVLKNGHVAVWVTAFLFSAMHMQFLTFAPRFILGALLGYMLLYGRSIWYPIVAHFFNNFMSLVVFYYYKQAKPDINPLDPNIEVPSVVWVIGSVFILTILLLLFRKVGTNKKGSITHS